MKKWIILIVSIVALLASISIVIMTTNHKADLLLVNATIYTLDPQRSVVEAVAIREGKILATGPSSDLRSRFEADSVIDLGGMAVVPGLIDGHVHMMGEGSSLHDLNLAHAGSPEEVAALVAERAHIVGEGKWILGRGWDQNRWQKKEFPSHDILTRAEPRSPVLLERVDGHAIWVNARAMELAGITRATQDPEGGKVYRDVKGNPTGIFIDNAMDYIYKVVPALTDDEVRNRLLLAMEECVRFGLTEVHDMGIDLQTLRVYKSLVDEKKCPLRIYAAIGGPGEMWTSYLSRGPEIGYGNGMLTVRAIKLYMDGALGSRGAALFDSYDDDPGNRGLTLMSEDEIAQICGQALVRNFQVCTHAIGDRANHIVLDQYEKALKTLPAGGPSPRWRIEHAQVVRLSDIPRFRGLGIIPSMQPTHATSDMPWAESRLGPERIKGAYAWRQFLDAGCAIVGGSDFPVESVNPLLGFYAAITRSDKEGNPPGGWRPEEKMTREEALRCFTQWAAFGSFEEGSKGTIEPNRWADLTVLDHDIMKVDPSEILSTAVQMTLVGGRAVYHRGVPRP